MRTQGISWQFVFSHNNRGQIPKAAAASAARRAKRGGGAGAVVVELSAVVLTLVQGP